MSNRAALTFARALFALFLLFVASVCAASASVLVNKAFSPTTVQLGVTSAVTITLSNTSILSAANITSFSDDISTMGGKAQFAASPSLANTCAGGSPSIAGTVVSLAGGVIPIAADSTHPGTCTISFNVVGASVGNGINSIAIGALVTDQGNNATAASQTLQVTGSSPTAAGSANVILLTTATATQTFTISNPNAAALTNAHFAISLSGGANQFSVTAGNTGACAGSVALSAYPATSGTATVSGLTIPASGGSCTITLTLTAPLPATNVTVTGTLATSAVIDDQGVTNTAAAVTGKSTFVNGRASFTKSFAPSTIVAGGTSRLTIVIGNTQTTALTSAAFSDTMPANLTLDAVPAATFSAGCTSPTLSGAGTGTLSISGGTIPATTTLGTAVTASTCTIVVTVDAASGASGGLANSIPAANFTNTQTVAAAGNANATLTISSSALTASLSLSPGSAARNAPVTATLTLSNGSASALSAGTFTDNLPQVSTSLQALSMQYFGGFTPTFTGCGGGGSVTPSGGNTVVTGNGLVIAGNATCTVKFQVLLTTGGAVALTDTDTIPAANITFTDITLSSVHPSTSPAANLATAPVFTIKNFVGPNYSGVALQPVAVQGQIVYGPALSVLDSDTNVSATFVLNPVGQHNLKLAPTPNFVFTGCPAGTTAANVAVGGASESFTLTPPGSLSATCTITYNVVNETTITPPSAAYGPGIDTYTSTENGGTSNSNPQNITVTFYTTSLLINTLFVPNSIASGGTATATFTLDVNGTAPLAQTQANGVTFADPLPANVTFATAINVTFGAGCQQAGQPAPSYSTAGSTLTFANISLLTVGVSQTDCVATFDVTSSFLGNTTNTIPIGGVTSTSLATNSQPASASLTVVAGVALQKTFLSPSFAIGDVNYVRFVVVNSSGGTLSSGTLTDNMPSSLGLTSLTAQPTAQGGDPASCGGTVSGTIGSNTFSLSGMSVAGATGPSAPGQCVQYIQVGASTSAAPGTLVNSIPAGALSIGGQTNLTGTSTPPQTLNGAPNATLSQTILPATILQHGVTQLVITIANTGSLPAPLSGLAVTDPLPTGVTIASPAGASTTCASGSVTAVAGSASLALAGGSLAANASCTITVSLTSALPNTYTNTIAAGSLTTTQGATNALSTATLTVTSAPDVTLSTAFTPASIAPNATSVVTTTLANTASGNLALSSVTLADNLPSGLSVAAIPNASTTCGPGTVTALAAATSVSLSGGTLAAGATCTLTVTVTGVTPNSYTNTIPAQTVTSFEGASNGVPASAVVTIVAPGGVTISKAFSPSTIAPNTNAALTITIANSGTGAIDLTGIALSDALPTGVAISAVSNASTTCAAGTVGAVAGASSLTLSGASLAAGASCTATTDVTGTSPSAYTNTIPANALTSTQTATNAAAANATLTIAAPNFTLGKAFSPATLVQGSSSLLTVTVTNTATSAVTLSGMAFTDAYPSGLVNAATPNAATTCGAGSVSATAGAASLALASGALAANASCTITVNVTAPVGTYTNTLATVTTTQGATNAAAATAGLTVTLAPNLTLSTAFAPASIAPNATSVVTTTLTNTATGNVSLSSLALSDALPTGLSVAAVPNASTTCGSGTVIALAAGTSLSLSGATLGAGATCTISVTVTGVTPNTYTNTIPAGNVTSSEGASNAALASAVLTLAAPGTVAISKAFSPSTIAPNVNSALKITIANTGTGAIALSTLSLSDALPSGLTIAPAPNASTTCPSGTASATAGGATLAVSGASLAAGAACTLSADVTSAIVAAYTNTIGANALSDTQALTNAAPASATLSVVAVPPVTITNSFSPPAILAGQSSVLTISLANTGTSAIALSNVALTDTLPSGLTLAVVPGSATTCSAGSVTAAAGAPSISLAGATLAAGASCIVSVNVTSTTPGALIDTIPPAAFSDTQNVPSAATASATLTVTAATTLTLSKVFAPASIFSGGITTLTTTIANTTAGSISLTSLALGDTLPAGVLVAAVPNASTTCGTGTVAASAGATTLALSAGTLSAGATCTVSVAVTSAVLGSHLDTSAVGAVTDAQSISNPATASASFTVAAAPAITLTQTFTPGTIAAGATSLLTLSLANTAAGAAPLTAATLTDSLPAGVVLAVVPNASTTCPAGASTASAGASTFTLSGATIAANATCTLTVTVVGNVAGTYTNTLPAGAVTTAQGASNATASQGALTVIAPTTLTLSKAFTPASITSGGTATLTATIANSTAGAIGLTSLAFQDVLPAGVVVAAAPNTATTCGPGAVTASAGTTIVKLAGATLGAGATCTVSISVTSEVLGLHVDTSAVSAVTDTQNVSNPATASASLAVAAAPAVALTQSFAPSAIVIGATSVLTLSLANTTGGAVALSGLVLADSLPSAIVVAAVPNATTTCPAGAVAAGAGAATFTLSNATLAPQASCTVTITVTGNTPGSYTNAIAAGALTSAQSATNTVATQAVLAVTGLPALTVTKTSDAQGAAVGPGQTITYTITIVNSGSLAETGAKITDVLANAAQLPGSVRVNGTPALDAVVTGAAPFGSIPVGATLTIVYRAIVNASVAGGSQVTNTVTVGGDQTCVGAACSAASLPDGVQLPNLMVTLLIDGQTSETVLLGQIVTYSALVKNIGGGAAQSVTLSDALPAGVTPIPGSVTEPSASGVPTSTVNGQTVTASVGTLTPGASTTVVFRATITAPIPGVANNLVSVGATGIPSVVVSNTVVARMLRALLTVTKAASAAIVRAGDRLDYTVRIVAPGGAVLGQTTIVDQLPPYILFAPGSARINGVANDPAVSGRTLTWTLPALGAAVMLTYATSVAAGPSSNATLTNIVNVTAASLAAGPAAVGSASVSVGVAASSFGSCYPITGRVYDDAKHSGRFEAGDAGLAGVSLVLNDGESVVTDAYGRYNFPCVRPGMHALRLDEQTLPPGSAAYAGSAIDSEQSTRRLIHSTFDSTIIQDVNFAIGRQRQ